MNPFVRATNVFKFKNGKEFADKDSRRVMYSNGSLSI